MDLGSCCICSGRNGVRSEILLPYRAAVPGHGWGCVDCGLPADGARAVLCDVCKRWYALRHRDLRYACRGYAATDGREPYRRDVPDEERFEHDLQLHGFGAK